jgi:FtsP/CotA-like multicopper oxidase with cupredoxin domain
MLPYRLPFRRSLKGITLSLTNANMTVIQLDGGGKIKPVQNIHSIGVLYPGERVDFLVDWNSLERESETSLVVTVDKE